MIITSLLIAVALAGGYRQDPTRAADWIGDRQLTAVSGVAIDPVDDARVYAAAAENGKHGLFRSEDAGLSWAMIAGAPSAQYVSSIHIDPRDPSRLFASAAALDPEARRGSDLYRSLDAGASWILVETFVEDQILQSSLAFEPSMSGTLYLALSAASWDGRFLTSEDAGETWSSEAAPFHGRIRLTTESSGSLLAVGTNGAFRRLAGKTAWTQVGVPPPECPYVRALVIDPENPSRMLAGTGSAGGGPFGWLVDCAGVFESLDGGATWAFSGMGYIADLVMAPAGSRAAYASQLVPSFVITWAGPGSIFRSGNGGETWEPAADIGATQLVVSPGGTRLYAVTAHGVRSHLLSRETRVASERPILPPPPGPP